MQLQAPESSAGQIQLCPQCRQQTVVPFQQAAFYQPPQVPFQPAMAAQGKGNTCGILGVVIGWLIPLIGLILGIVALARKEDAPALGIIAIAEACLFFFIWMAAWA